ncbi:MAG: SDR family NAD(P)-dependent oxidoreductase [Polyangiales bacterium]
MSKNELVTSTDYAHPHRPAPIRVFNRLGAAAGSRGRAPSLAVDDLLEEASRSVGLTDFGDPSFREPLSVLCDAIEHEAQLHALGRSIMHGRLVGMLVNRLRIEQLHQENPGIGAIAIRKPIVIAGLQRTGTTMLHRLLAADPRARALMSWEALSPAPLPGEGRRGSFRRRANAKLAEVGLKGLAPEFFAIHPVEADAPEEDVLLLDNCFTSQAPEATLHVPSYASWLETQDLVPSYRYLARTLKVLDWQRAGQFWVLKTPHHMEYLRELLTVFPDAVIVHTHRDPQATMGSFCSMVAHGRGVFSDHVDAREVGRHWLRKVDRMIERSLAVRDGGRASSFVDVSYYDVLKDPIAEVRRIYAHAGLELIPEAEAAMREVVDRDKQHRYGRHVYRTRDFGLSPAMIEETFASYRSRFSIPKEKTEKGTEIVDQAKASGLGHNNPVTATVTAILDIVSKEGLLPGIDASVRLDGKTAMITGANSGLGKAIAIDLARRGARLILACRSGIPEAGREIALAAGSSKIEMIKVDLSDLDSVEALAAELAKRGETLDLLVCNAGLMPSKAQKTKQGFEVMFAVHYVANHLLIRKLLANGTIPNDVYAKNGRHGTAIPRIVFVSSEAHRSCEGLDFDRFGEFVDYGLADGMTYYGASKLALTTFSTELGRRLVTKKGPSVAVHTLCPGPVDSKIARDAPAFIQPLLEPVMHAFFRSPEAAAEPAIFLSAAPELAGDTGWYMHLMRRKNPSPQAMDEKNGATLWEKGEALLASRLR